MTSRRIVITGATGLVGRALSYALIQRGDEVVALSRDPQRASGCLPLIAAHYEWEPLRSIAPPEALRGADAIVHLAGEPVVGRWTAEKKALIRDSRIVGTRHLVEALDGMDDAPTQMVCASAVGFYGDRGDEELTEESLPGDDFLATTCVEWENASAEAMDLGMDVAHLRIGLVLAAEGGALKTMRPAFEFGVGGPLGDGLQWWSWIHLQDLVRMTLAALDQRWCGAFNVVAPEPVMQGEFARTLAGLLRRPSLVPAPAFVLRALLGEFSTELLTSKRVVPETAQRVGFEFAYSGLESALADLLD